MQGIELYTSLIKRFISLIYNNLYTTYRFCFPLVFKWTANRGGAAAIFAFGTGVTMIALYFFSPNASPVPFYLFAALSQFFFSGFNTAIYTIIPDCVEYGEWVTGVRNDGFQYAFISLGNKIGMALGISLLALALGAAGYVSNAAQNETVLSIMRHAFSTIPGIPLGGNSRRPVLLQTEQTHLQPHRGGHQPSCSEEKGLRSIAK